MAEDLSKLTDAAVKDRIKENIKLQNSLMDQISKLKDELKILKKRLKFNPTEEELQKRITIEKLSKEQLYDREKVLLKKIAQSKNTDMNIITDLKAVWNQIGRMK